jgi:hypothetical protein
MDDVLTHRSATEFDYSRRCLQVTRECRVRDGLWQGMDVTSSAISGARRWYGHTERMKVETLPKSALHGHQKKNEEEEEGNVHRVENTYEIHYGKMRYGKWRLGEQITVDIVDIKPMKG